MRGVLLVLVLFGCMWRTCPAQFLYYTETDFVDGFIGRVRVEGSGRETLASTTSGIRGIDIALHMGYLYWSDTDTGSLLRAPLDDVGGAQTVVAGLGFPSDIAIDEPRNLMAWSDQANESVGVAALDGSGLRELVSGVVTTSIAVDATAGVVYFDDRASVSQGAIRRVSFDGTGLETVIDDIPSATSMAVDPIHRYVYWGSSAGFDNTGGVYRVRFDGTGFEEIFKSSIPLRDATSVTLDLEQGFVYFALDEIGDRQDLYRIALDGANPTLLASDFAIIPDMTILVPAPASVVTLALGAVLTGRRHRM